MKQFSDGFLFFSFSQTDVDRSFTVKLSATSQQSKHYLKQKRKEPIKGNPKWSSIKQ